MHILDGTINDKVVAGSASANNGSVTVKGDTNLLMEGGVVKSDLVGGNLIDGGTQAEGLKAPMSRAAPT